MKLIDISTSKYPNTFAMVDDEDFEFLNQFSWSPNRGGYARGRGPLGHEIRMHRLIMKTPEGMATDHIDGNILNNQKSNLRIVTQRQNAHNRRKAIGQTSQYIGVYFDKDTDRFIASIKHRQKARHGGSFKTEREAALARDKMARQYFGETARLNFPNIQPQEVAA